MFNGTHPYQGCTLMQLPLGVSPYQWQRGPEASTFSSGYVTGASPGMAYAVRSCTARQMSLWGSSSSFGDLPLRVVLGAV